MPFSWPHTLAGRLYVQVRDKTVLRSDGNSITFDCGTALMVAGPDDEGALRVLGHFLGAGAVMVADEPDQDVFRRCDANSDYALGTLRVCWSGKEAPECSPDGVTFNDGSRVLPPRRDGTGNFVYIGSGVLGLERLERVPDPAAILQSHRLPTNSHEQRPFRAANRQGALVGAGA